MSSARFPFRFHPAFTVPAALLGVTPSNSEVVIHDDELVARFGRWSVRTPLGNITSATVTGPYSWPKVIGPAHVSLADRGLTFASNPDEGVCIRFERPVRGAEPLGLLRHPALTVTVEDTAALAELLDRPAHDLGRTHGSTGEVTVDELIDDTVIELRSMTAAELRSRANELGMTGTSRMNKAQLIEALTP
jgi:hypothetical protein